MCPIPFDDPTSIDSGSVCKFASLFILDAKRGLREVAETSRHPPLPPELSAGPIYRASLRIVVASWSEHFKLCNNGA